MGNFLLLLLLHTPSPSPSLQAHISASRPISQSWGPNSILEAQIPWGWNLALGLGFGPWGWDLGHKTGILALRLGYGLRGWDMTLEAWGRGGDTGEEEGENSPYVWPLWGRCRIIGRLNWDLRGLLLDLRGLILDLREPVFGLRGLLWASKDWFQCIMLSGFLFLPPPPPRTTKCPTTQALLVRSKLIL